MKRTHLSSVAFVLPFLAISIGANAGLIASDDSSIAWMNQSRAQTFAVSTLSASDAALASDVLGDYGQIHPDEDFNRIMVDDFLANTDNNSRTKPHTNSHMDFWLLLIVTAVVGILSEIFHRRSCKR